MLTWIRLNRFNFHGNYPIGCISKICGILPFYVSKEAKLQSTWSFYLNVFYTLLCFLFYVGCFILSICYSSYRAAFPQICIIGHAIHIFLGFFICVHVYINGFRNSKLFTLQLQFNFIDDCLFKISGLKDSFVEKNNRFQMSMTLAGLIMFVISFILDFLIFYSIFGSTVIIFVVSYLFPYIVSSLAQAQFISIIFAIHLRFEEINKYLNHIANVNEITSKAVKMYKEHDEKTTDELIRRSATTTPILFMLTKQDSFVKPNNDHKLDNGEQQKQQIKKKGKSSDNSQLAAAMLPKDIHKHMDILFSLHDQLLDISEKVNNFFSLQIVSFITVSFVIILFGFFFETKVIFWLWGQNTQYILIASSYMVWSVLMAIIIYTLLTICSKAREEAYESALIVHKILQNKPVFMLNDEIYYNKMKSFTLQILHRKNTFNFNGLGLFQLDYTFIFSAVSAATSYLIVLLQFDLSTDLG